MQAQTVTSRIKNERIQNNAVQGGTSVPKKDVWELNFADPIEFNGQTGLKVTTTMSLCKLVNLLFRALPDYEGCIIQPDQTGNLQCSLYFHLSPQQSETSIVVSADQMATKVSNDAMRKYQSMSMRTQSRKMYLTDVGKEILFNFIYKQGNVTDINKINWNQLTSETVDQQGAGTGVPLLKVAGIDLLKIIPKFYKNFDKRYYQWNIQVMRPIGMAGVGIPNYMVNISRLDTKEVEVLMGEIGFLTSAGSIPIVR